METINRQNTWEINTNNVLSILLLQEGVKDKASELFNKSDSPEDLAMNLNNTLSSEEKIENIFINIRNTDFEGIKTWRSKIDWLEYIFDEKLKKILEIWFYEIFEVIENDWKIIFQAIDTQIDWLYWYYEYNGWNLVSKLDDKKINFIEETNLSI